MTTSRRLTLTLMMGLTALLAACGGAPALPTTAPASPTTRPIVKPTDRPTVTPNASPSPTIPPASPTPTTDARLIDLTAPDVNPLTGEKVTDPAVLNRRPLAIKIGDSMGVSVFGRKPAPALPIGSSSTNRKAASRAGRRSSMVKLPNMSAALDRAASSTTNFPPSSNRCWPARACRAARANSISSPATSIKKSASSRPTSATTPLCSIVATTPRRGTACWLFPPKSGKKPTSAAPTLNPISAA